MTRTLARLCLALSLLPAAAALAAPAAQVTEATGYVTITNGAGAPVSAKKGGAVESGQTITTGHNGQAVLKFQDGQVIALKSGSIFKINSYNYDPSYPEKGESVLALLQGGLRAITGLLGERNRAGWRLATPTATMGIRGTDFFVAIQQFTYVKVNIGAVTFTNAGGTAIVAAGEAASITSAGALGTIVPIPQIPAGVFTELEAMSLTGALGGPAAGGAGIGGATVGGVPAWAVGVGIAAGVGAAAAGGGSGDDQVTTPSHH